MKKFLLRLWKEKTAQDLVEYALLMFLIALVAGSTVRSLGTRIGDAYTSAAGSIATTTGAGNGANNGNGNNGNGNK